MKIILASSSIYRRQLLEKLQIPFTYIKPNIDETAKEGESAEQLVSRLAKEKAFAINCDEDDFIIASDQVALAPNGNILGKPGSLEKAIKQLKEFSKQKVVFKTALVLRKNMDYKLVVEDFTVHFRNLNEDEIRKYVQLEKPIDCAGSFKSEGLGILLFEKLSGSDPNSLIGLPLIALNNLFLQYGVNLIRDFSEYKNLS